MGFGLRWLEVYRLVAVMLSFRHMHIHVYIPFKCFDDFSYEADEIYKGNM